MTERPATQEAVEPLSNGRCDFDPLSNELASRPHEVYAELRARCPVAHSDRWGGFTPLTRYRDVVKAATQPRVFTSTEGIVVPKNPVSGRRAPMHFDPPEHTRYRRAMNAAFREDRVLAREGELRQLASELLDPLIERDEPRDLVADFSSPFTCHVLVRFLSLGEEDGDVLDEHTQRFEQAQVARDNETAEAENQFLYEMARQTVAARHAEPFVRQRTGSADCRPGSVRTQAHDERRAVSPRMCPAACRLSSVRRLQGRVVRQGGPHWRHGRSRCRRHPRRALHSDASLGAVTSSR